MSEELNKGILLHTGQYREEGTTASCNYKGANRVRPQADKKKKKNAPHRSYVFKNHVVFMSLACESYLILT